MRKFINRLLIILSVTGCLVFASSPVVANVQDDKNKVTITNNGNIACIMSLQNWDFLGPCGGQFTGTQTVENKSIYGSTEITFDGLKCGSYTLSGSIPTVNVNIGAHVHLTGDCNCSDCPYGS